MPTYKEKIERLLFEEDVRKMYDLARTNDERVLVSILWITGARPAEIMRSKGANESIGLKAGSCFVEPNTLSINLNTLKRGIKVDFQVKQRTLVFKRGTNNNNIYIETLVNQIQSLSPDSEILPYTTRWGEKVINRLGKDSIGVPISPYHFRHSVMTWLVQNGKTELEVQYWKGAASLSGVRPYLHARPMMVNIMDLRRSRQRTEPDFVSEIGSLADQNKAKE